jgi:hypothetical protein
MQSARYSCQILKKCEFSRHILEKYSNIKPHENPSSGSRTVPCGQTADRLANNRQMDGQRGNRNLTVDWNAPNKLYSLISTYKTQPCFKCLHPISSECWETPLTFVWPFIVTNFFITKPTKRKSGFSGLEVACWPLEPKVEGSNPAEAVRFFRAKKNPQHAFLRRFTAFKRSLNATWKSNISGKIYRPFLSPT